MRALKNNTHFIKYKIYRINLTSSFGIYLEDGRHFKNCLHFLLSLSLPNWPVPAMPLLLSVPWGRLCATVAHARDCSLPPPNTASKFHS